MSDQTPDAPMPQPTEAVNDPDHAQLAPEDQDPTDVAAPRMVHLPALISDEYGMTRSAAREMILMGTVDIDGDESDGRTCIDVPYDDVKGKDITVRSEYRSVKFRYDG